MLGVTLLRPIIENRFGFLLDLGFHLELEDYVREVFFLFHRGSKMAAQLHGQESAWLERGAG